MVRKVQIGPGAAVSTGSDGGRGAAAPAEVYRVIDGLSHDVRTPLGVMLGFTDLLLDGAGGPLTDEQRRLLDHVRAGGDRIVAILQRYLREAEAGPGGR